MLTNVNVYGQHIQKMLQFTVLRYFLVLLPDSDGYDSDGQSSIATAITESAELST